MDSIKHYWKGKSPLIRKLTSHPALALLSHWLFQGIFYLQRSELVFKLLLEWTLFCFFFVLLVFLLGPLAALALALVLAHTINFLFNAHFWSILKFFGYGHYDRASFIIYVEQFAERARREMAIRQVLVYGSMARREWTATSDFDARITHRDGLASGLRACWFLFKERSRAFIARFPLDVYVVDNLATLSDLREASQCFDILSTEW
jgi:hypothetical protein